MLDRLLADGVVTEESTLRSRVGVMAIHGGGLERTTDLVARLVAERAGASYYGVLFPDHVDASDHVPSTRFDPDHSPLLGSFLDQVDSVVSIHGYGRHHLRYSVLLGGRNRALAEHVAAVASPWLIDFDFVTDLRRIPRPLRGQHPDNPVNLPPQTGVQVELPPSLRWNWAERGWSDTGDVGRAPQLDRFIAALTEAVAAWPVRAPVAR